MFPREETIRQLDVSSFFSDFYYIQNNSITYEYKQKRIERDQNVYKCQPIKPSREGKKEAFLYRSLHIEHIKHGNQGNDPVKRKKDSCIRICTSLGNNRKNLSNCQSIKEAAKRKRVQTFSRSTRV